MVTWGDLNVLDVCGGLLRLSDSGGHHRLTLGSDSSTSANSYCRRCWSPQVLQNSRARNGGRCCWSHLLNDGFWTVHFVADGAGWVADTDSQWRRYNAGGSRSGWSHKRHRRHSLLRRCHVILRDSSNNRRHRSSCCTRSAHGSVVDRRGGLRALAAGVNRRASGHVTVQQDGVSIQSLDAIRSTFTRRLWRYRYGTAGCSSLGLRLNGCHVRFRRRRGPSCSIHARSVGSGAASDTSSGLLSAWRQRECLTALSLWSFGKATSEAKLAVTS